MDNTSVLAVHVFAIELFIIFRCKRWVVIFVYEPFCLFFFRFFLLLGSIFMVRHACVIEDVVVNIGGLRGRTNMRMKI